MRPIERGPWRKVLRRQLRGTRPHVHPVRENLPQRDSSWPQRHRTSGVIPFDRYIAIRDRVYR